MIGILGSGDAVWLAMGWTMLHVLWVGAAIGVVAAVAARATRSARPEIRYVIALAFLALMGVSPMVVFARIYDPLVPTNKPIAIEKATLEIPSSQTHEPTITTERPTGMLAVGGFAPEPARDRLEPVVAMLPWVWLAGSCLTLVSLAAGLIGVERLRRSSRLVAGSAIEEQCRQLAASLRIARSVSVGVCDRLAGPILIGVIRPLILLPSAALTGWTPNELEMVLLHELAHVRRWDNLVNIIQRVIEALLFFHPAAWWLSAWVRLERELACDRLVVGRLGEPFAYAEMLLLMATSRRPGPGVASALADRQAATRIRRLLNRGDRSMKLTMPEGLGLAGSVVVAAFMAFGLRASDPPADAKDREIGQALAQAAADLAALPLDPSNRMSRPTAMIDLASAQLAMGDKKAAKETFKKVGESFGPAVESTEILQSLFPLAQAQRKAGDAAGARATLDRLQKHMGLVTDKALVDAMNKDKSIPPAPEGQEDPRPALIRCEMLLGIADERIELGDRARAITIARDAMKMVKTDSGPAKAAPPGGRAPGAVKASIKNETIMFGVDMLGAGGMIQHKAGDPDWRSRFAEARRLAGTLSTPQERAETLPTLARFLTETGEVEQAVEVATALEPGARTEAFREMIEALVDGRSLGYGVHPAYPGNFKMTIGAESFTLKDRESALRTLPKIAQALRADAGVGPLYQAWLLSMVAHLQAKGGDFAAARETAMSIPALKRADDPGLADGSYGAVQPVTLALVAKERAQADQTPIAQREAADLFRQAAVLARDVATPEQKAVALIAIAQAASGVEQALTSSLIGEAKTTALGLKDPVKSLALALVVDLEADAGDLAVATLTAQAIRDDYPGLEKHQALSRIADEWDKRGDQAVARDLRRKALVFLKGWPSPDALAQMGRPREMRSFTLHSYTNLGSEVEMYRRAAAASTRAKLVDFELESDGGSMAWYREAAAASTRAKLVDHADAIAAVRKLPAGQRDGILVNLVGQMARDGKPIEALKLAKTLETPAQRLTAIELVATAIRDGRSTK